MQNLPFGQIVRGDAPVLVVTPHTGTSVPPALAVSPIWAAIEGRLADPFGQALQTCAAAKGVTTISAVLHPCVIDFNVAPDNRPLSARLNRLGLCRTHSSRGEALYEAGREPSEAEVAARMALYWDPFHAAVSAELARLRTHHPHVLLWVSHVSSWLSPFRDQPGVADCNIGTALGAACDRRLLLPVTKAVQALEHSWVVNGRIGDVFAAQHYGNPDEGLHAIEVEVAGRWRAECEVPDKEPADADVDTATTPDPIGSTSAILDELIVTLQRMAHEASPLPAPLPTLD